MLRGQVDERAGAAEWSKRQIRNGYRRLLIAQKSQTKRDAKRFHIHIVTEWIMQMPPVCVQVQHKRISIWLQWADEMRWDGSVVRNGSQFAESELRDDSDSRSLFAWAWLLVRWSVDVMLDEPRLFAGRHHRNVPLVSLVNYSISPRFSNISKFIHYLINHVETFQ